eukprot:TRINITY_DN9577_c0_g1_i1.p1 TRINITY_DN9577_c0_g1~~TRINITY_DN9577_c0_g1_i1.p1  ORF type:complete len:362 (+),score=98.83 TRINITY_DN9577_c0_g1_i1:258-1343(+)
MKGWQDAGYFTGANVYIFRYEGPPPEQLPVQYTQPVYQPVPEPPAKGGSSTMQGRRQYQEDRFVVVNDLHTLLHDPTRPSFWGRGASLFGVFDGHQGPEAADYCSKHMAGQVARQLEAAANAGQQQHEGVEAAMTAAFEAIDTAFLLYAKRKKVKHGCTACVALVLDSWLYVANVGDSRAVLNKGGDALRCTKAHSPGDEDEKSRIRAAGGEVICLNGVWRVKVHNPELEAKAKLGNCEPWEKPPPMLAVSRSIGDRQLKLPHRLIDAKPDVTRFELGLKDDLLFIGCDGVFDVLTDQQAIDLASSAINEDRSPIEAARRVITKAYQLDAPDNLTGVAVYMKGVRDVGQKKKEETEYTQEY